MVLSEVEKYLDQIDLERLEASRELDMEGWKEKGKSKIKMSRLRRVLGQA